METDNKLSKLEEEELYKTIDHLREEAEQSRRERDRFKRCYEAEKRLRRQYEEIAGKFKNWTAYLAAFAGILTGVLIGLIII